MTTYALCIGTYNRGAENYLAQTLASLDRGGVFRSAIPHVVHLCDGGSRERSHRLDAKAYPATVHLGRLGQSAMQTAMDCLRVGIDSGADWIIVCEDDIVVCRNFLESVDAWLSNHAGEYSLYSFYGAYREILHAYKRGGSAIELGIRSFYGTQCWVVTPDNAESILRYAATDPYWSQQTTCWDLMLKDWSQAVYPTREYFLFSAPCFVDHIGRKSALGNDAQFHQAQSWQGPEWSYVDAV